MSRSTTQHFAALAGRFYQRKAARRQARLEHYWLGCMGTDSPPA